jgi:hypothetical protein
VGYAPANISNVFASPSSTAFSPGIFRCHQYCPPPPAGEKNEFKNKTFINNELNDRDKTIEKN